MFCGLNSLAIRSLVIVKVKSKIAVIVLGETVLVCREGPRTHNDFVTQVKLHRGFYPLTELTKTLRRITLWICRFYSRPCPFETWKGSA